MLMLQKYSGKIENVAHDLDTKGKILIYCVQVDVQEAGNSLKIYFK